MIDNFRPAIIQDIHTEKHHVKYIVMDDDTTTLLSHIRKDYDPNKGKWSDINNAKKSLTNALYSGASIDNKVISYLKECYAYVLAQNKNDVDAIKKGLRYITPHVFGEHSECGFWCGLTKYGASNKFKSLPRGQCLIGNEMKELDSHQHCLGSCIES